MFGPPTLILYISDSDIKKHRTLTKIKNYYLSVRDCCLPVSASTFFGSMAKALS